MLQVELLFKDLDRLHQIYGSRKLRSIYGCGCVKRPRLFFVLMNPTARNISADPKWKGLVAPWLGTKSIWRLLYSCGLLKREIYEQTQKLKPDEWTEKFSADLYNDVAGHKVYLTSLAKCTQDDARPLGDRVFRDYLELARREIQITDPKIIVTFGNQVSSILLGRKVRMAEMVGKNELININGKNYLVYPTFYPVGQGLRNLPKAIDTIKHILNG